MKCILIFPPPYFFLKSLGVLWPVDEAYSRLTTRQPERFWTSGQWMTERQGGSDVGQWLTNVSNVHDDVIEIVMQLYMSNGRALIGTSFFLFSQWHRDCCSWSTRWILQAARIQVVHLCDRRRHDAHTGPSARQ